jgi:hypothetical protein
LLKICGLDEHSSVNEEGGLIEFRYYRSECDVDAKGAGTWSWRRGFSDDIDGSATRPMSGNDQAIKQVQSRNLDPARFSDAVEDGGDFSHRTLPLPKTPRSPK